MINLVIVAGGKQTRFNALSVFPKVLLPSATSCSILKELVDKTKNLEVSLKRWIVINKQYSEQLRTYVKVNGLQNDLEIVESTNTNGSFNTLREIKDRLPHENVLFIWSDLSLTDFSKIFKICEKCIGSGILFTNSGSYRYGASGYALDDSGRRLLDNVYQSPSSDGNIPGIYFLKDLAMFEESSSFRDDEVVDLVDVISALHDDQFEVCDLKDIDTKLIEYRDLGVYKKCIKENFKEDKLQTRFFNSLVVDPTGKTMTKRAIDPAYVHLVQKEIDWYTRYASLARDHIVTPKIYGFDKDSLTMDYLESYKPLHLVLDTLEKNSEISKIKKLYDNVFDAVDCVAGISTLEVPISTFKEDLRREVVTKVIDRCEKIKAFLVNYEKEGLEGILEEVFDQLVSFASNSGDCDIEQGTMRYWFCHGDLNGSNILVDEKTLDVKFVDPRGYFGSTNLYGWKPYENAKLLYCLYGYDDFNTKPQIYTEDWPQLRSSLEYSGFKYRSFAYNGSYRNYQMLVGVIYVALAGYISQDIMKANIAYDYGMRILKWTLGRD